MIRILAMDVDGTLTDGKIYMGENGEVMKMFDIKDGYAIYKFLPENNIVPVIVTGRTSKIVECRAAELGIVEIYQGVSDKAEQLQDIALLHSCNCKDIAYIGDDENDLPAMRVAGVTGCPANANASVIAAADYVSKYRGGDGAVRDFIEWVIRDAEQHGND